MSTAQLTPAPPDPARIPWNTPQVLSAGLTAVFAACLLFMLAAILGARSHRNAMQAVGRDSAPSIIAAEHIRSALAGMDANAANELLGMEGVVAARRAFENRRQEAIEAIVTAAQNITYGDAERVPILKLASGIGVYASGIQQARDLRAASNKNFIQVYREAAKFLDETLLPAASDLDKANREVLDRTYAKQQRVSGLSLSFLIISALLAGALLIALQIFVARRMRRVLNPMLLGATAILLVFTLYSGRAFRAEDRDLKIAKEDAFESIHALWLARSVAYSAHSDQSRYLLDSAQADQNERSFRDKADRIAHLPPEMNRAYTLRDIAGGRHFAEFTGFMANELNNITFPGERGAAVETLTRFFDYLDVSREVRGLEKSGEHQAAVALCTGNREGQSNLAFNRFDESLGRTLDINRQAFDASVEQGFRDVAGLEVTAPMAALAIALLTWLGLRPRISEYSV